MSSAAKKRKRTEGVVLGLSGAGSVALGTYTLLQEGADWRTYAAGVFALVFGLWLIWRFR